MRFFLFSGRFLIPLFIIWIFHLGYIVWEISRLYLSDINGKGFSTSFIVEWLFLQAAGDLMILAFLVAFHIGITVYTHYNVKRERFIAANFFSARNFFAALLFAIATFLYGSYIAPKNKLKSLEMLAAFIYAKNNDELKVELATMRGHGRKNSGMMTLPELFRAKDSLKALDNIDEKYDFPYLNHNQRELDRIRYEIGKKFSLPLITIVFYFMGIFLGASLYRVHVLIPVLISYLILFTSWYYLQRVIEKLYHRQVIGVFFVAGGTAILFALLAVAWFFILRKYGMFTKKNDDVHTSDESIDFESKEVE